MGIKKKILFLIHDLGQGGAEKVLVNLVNNMDDTKFDITVMTLFDVGINRQFLSKRIRYRSIFSRVFKGNSHVMKLFSPKMLHRLFIKEHYDIEVAYLEGPCARIISGCHDMDTKLVSWVHIEQSTSERAAASFRNIEEAQKCYNRFHQIVCVSAAVKNDFTSVLSISAPVCVLYNTNETQKIVCTSKEAVDDVLFLENEIKLVGVGKLLSSKGFDRVLRITKRLREEGFPVHTYILGIGPEEQNLKKYVTLNGLDKYVDLLGYRTNPYKYVAKCDLFVCASFAEGFSTATTEALIVGVPVCTVNVSGMNEMLGCRNEYGIVTDNDEGALYQGILHMIGDSEVLAYYKKKAIERGKFFNMKTTVNAVEEMLWKL